MITREAWYKICVAFLPSIEKGLLKDKKILRLQILDIHLNITSRKVELVGSHPHKHFHKLLHLNRKAFM